MYTAYRTPAFDKLCGTLDKHEQQWISKTINKLEDNPLGKILRYDWFREKKYTSKRLFFIIDELSKRILLIAFAHKKEQQTIINKVIANKEELFRYIRSL